MHFEAFFTIEGLIILLLFIATVVARISHRWRIPYTIGLVVTGLVLAPFEQSALLKELNFQIGGPELILGLLVPPLIFEAAFHLRLEDLNRNWKTILVLAVPGVIITTLIVGGLISWAADLSLITALLFGALVSATDPVAVIALFRSIGVPKQLAVLLEGESLFNDGTAIVVFNLILVSLLENKAFVLVESIGQFIFVAGGGVIVGLILGTFISSLISRIDAPLIEGTLTTVLAYGSYSLAELLGVSGVLAVVAAGIVGGTIGRPKMSPTANIVVSNLWEFAAFIANSFIFMIIGLEIQLTTLSANIPLILLAILVVLFVRALVVFGLTWVERIEFSWKKVLYWGSLRGAISLALLISLTEIGGVPGIEQIQAMTYGVVLFTLLVQGITMGPLVRRENLIRRRSTIRREYQRRHARAVAAKVAYEHVLDMNQQGILSEQTWETVSPILAQRSRMFSDEVRKLVNTAPEVQSEELYFAWRETLHAMRASYSDLRNESVIGEEIFNDLVSDVDILLLQNKTGWTDLIWKDEATAGNVKYLVTAIVQEQDSEDVTGAMLRQGFPTQKLPTSGGYLDRKNSTLLIGVPEGGLDSAIKSIAETSSHREMARPPEVSPLPLPESQRIQVKGATLFIFEVEQYEEF